MNKKQFIHPECRIISVESMTLLAGSDPKMEPTGQRGDYETDIEDEMHTTINPFEVEEYDD